MGDSGVGVEKTVRLGGQRFFLSSSFLELLRLEDEPPTRCCRAERADSSEDRMSLPPRLEDEPLLLWELEWLSLLL